MRWTIYLEIRSKNLGKIACSPLFCWGQARYLGMGALHVDLTLINSTWLGKKVKFLKILWGYGFESTVVSFQGWSDASTLDSCWKSQGKDFNLIIALECQADTYASLARTGACEGWKTSKCACMLMGIRGIFKKEFECNSQTGNVISDLRLWILGYAILLSCDKLHCRQ